MAEKLHGGEPPASAQVDGFRYAPHHINDFHLVVDGHSFLREISELHGFSDDKASLADGHFAEEHFDESGFSRTVVSDDAHLFVAGEIVIEVAQNDGSVLKDFGHILCLKDFAADVSAFDVKACHPFFGAAPCLLLQFTEGFLARPALVSASLWLPSHPFDFLAVKVSCAVDVSIGCGNAFFAFFEIIGVVSTVGIHGAVVEFHDSGAYTVEEITVVCDEEQGFGLTLQILFEPFNHFQIEMVGRLVKD